MSRHIQEIRAYFPPCCWFDPDFFAQIHPHGTFRRSGVISISWMSSSNSINSLLLSNVMKVSIMYYSIILISMQKMLKRFFSQIKFSGMKIVIRYRSHTRTHTRTDKDILVRISFERLTDLLSLRISIAKILFQIVCAVKCWRFIKFSVEVKSFWGKQKNWKAMLTTYNRSIEPNDWMKFVLVAYFHGIEYRQFDER